MKVSCCVGKIDLLPPATTMIRSHPISAEEASILAIAALDSLVIDLVKASRLKLSPAFLDWVADEATPLVERHVARSFKSPRFADSLRIGDPRIAMARWVRHWVCPWIVSSFEQLAEHLPEFADSRPAGLAPESVRRSRRLGYPLLPGSGHTGSRPKTPAPAQLKSAA